MAQRKAKKAANRSRRERLRHPVSGTLARQLEHVEDLVDAKKMTEAWQELSQLCRRYPNRTEPLSWLVHVSQARSDDEELQQACERLLRLQPNDREVTMLLAVTCLQLGRVATARRTFLRFLAQWPADPQAEQIRATVIGLERHIRNYLGHFELPAEKMWELADQHEQVLTLIARHQHERARQLAENLLAEQPGFIAGWNNLSLALFYLGDIAAAIEASEQALKLDADNFQALSNLIRCLAMMGRRDQASALADRLKTVQSDSQDLFVKQAEALAVLSDDEGMLEVLRVAEAHGRMDGHSHALVLHYAAVACTRLGDEPKARDLWRRALQIDPTLELAQGNLDDLEAPAEEREGPWAFNLPNLIPPVWLERLRPGPSRAHAQTTRNHLRRVLERYPEIVAAARVAMEVCEPAVGQLFIAMASDSEEPKIVEAIKDFALGQRGPFSMRSRATQMLSRKGFLPPGPCRLWQGGEWREIESLSFEISGEAKTSHTPAVARLADKAMAAMNRGEFAASERLWRQALELEPDKPDLLNNLATSMRNQGRKAEANALLDELLRDHPDYLFGRVNGAHRLIEEGKFEAAHELLKPVYQRRHLHVSEFIGLACAWINLLISEGKAEAARPWLAMWEQVAPEHPQLPYWRSQLPSKSNAKRVRFL